MPLIDPPLELLPHTDLQIGGERIRASGGGVYAHRYPATACQTACVPLAGADEMDRAVRAARAALPGWRGLSPDRRRDLMFGLCRLILEHAEQLGRLQTLETGVPVRFSSSFPATVADYFAYNAGWADKIGGAVVSTWPTPAFDYAIDEPYGVVAIIIPWNSPLMSIGQILSAALAAGNTVVLKPPELAPFTSLQMGELCLRAGFPAGVVNVVPAGPLGGEALVRHSGIDKIHFTGSCATARKVLAAALDNLTPAGLELGGKSAVVVFEDADLGAAAQHAVSGAVILSGQGCANGTRVLVQARVYDRMLTFMKGFMRRIVIGDPFDPATQMGPVITSSACDRILAVIERASRNAEGRLAAGGERLGGELSAGYFIAPTIFADVDPESPLARDEIFGPVVSVLRFESEDQAVELADATNYGLAGYVYSNDVARADRVARKLQAGSVWINGWAPASPSMPFGGTKQSGYGRVGGIQGIREFTRPKNIWRNGG